MAQWICHLLVISLATPYLLTIAGQDMVSSPGRQLSDAHRPLSVLLSKRSSGLSLLGPSLYQHYYKYRTAPAKRDNGYWVWMPAQGYMTIHQDEISNMGDNKEGVNNLLRYG